LRALFPVTVASALLVSVAGAGTVPWTPEAILGLKRVADPQVSPDGRTIAFVLTELARDSSQYRSNLWLAPVDAARSDGAKGFARLPLDGMRRLTTGNAHDTSPRWSPDGGSLSFVSDRPLPGGAPGGPGAGQLWLLPVAGGEPRPLTDTPGGVRSPQWSADGRFLCFLSSGRGAATDSTVGGAEPADSSVAWSRLWKVDVATKRETRLTGGDLHVTSFSIDPDGRRVVFAAQPTPDPAGALASDLWMVPVAGGAAVSFVRRPGEDELPSFSPDGRWVAFIGQPDGDTTWWSNRHLYLINAAGGGPADLTVHFDGQAEGARAGDGALWERGGESLLFTAIDRTDRRIFRAFSDARPVQPVMKSTGIDEDASLGGPGPVLAWTHEESTSPPDVWIWPLPDGFPHPLTEVSPDIADHPAFRKQVVTWSSRDGRQVEGLFVSPPGFTPGGAPPPLLVVLHGGPDWTHLDAFTGGNPVYPYPLFVQRGWAILFPNPRGSAGYGEAFRGAIEHDWGGVDLDDVLSGASELARLGLADSARTAVCGWSYGGYLAALAVTRTHRFRAAVVGAGMTDLGAMLAGDAPELGRWYLGSWPWEDDAAWVGRSPLYHAGSVTTPTAFVHGADDFRVPATQALEMWHALKARGVPTDLLLLPGEGHLPHQPRHQLATMRFQLDWLTKWTTGPAARDRATTPAPAKRKSR